MYMYKVAPQRKKNNEQIDAFHTTKSTPTLELAMDQ